MELKFIRVQHMKVAKNAQSANLTLRLEVSGVFNTGVSSVIDCAQVSIQPRSSSGGGFFLASLFESFSLTESVQSLSQYYSYVGHKEVIEKDLYKFFSKRRNNLANNAPLGAGSFFPLSCSII